MTYRVRLRPSALADLLALHDHIAESSGLGVAGAYVQRISSVCSSLVTFPKRGIKRDDIRAGLRIMGFERRASIAFVIDGSDVVIVRIFYGGRNLEEHLHFLTEV